MTLTDERKQLWLEYIKAVRTKNSDLAQDTIHKLSTMIAQSIVKKDK